MALTVGLCVEGNRHYPYTPVAYSKKMIAAATFDGVLVASLVVIGILAIIGSGVGTNHALHGIGTIGKLGGGLMIGGALLVAILDGNAHCCCTGFESDAVRRERVTGLTAVQQRERNDRLMGIRH